MILLDTNIILLYLQAHADIKAWIDGERLRDKNFAISTVTVLELLSYSNISSIERALIQLFLRNLFVIDVDITIARAAAQLRVENGLKAMDSMVAATALVLNIPLATRDSAFQKLRKPSIIVP